MLPVVLALIAAARVFFQSRTDIAVEVLALSPPSGRSEAETVSATVAPPGSALLDSPAGALVSLEGFAFRLSNRKRSSVGIGLDFGFIGVGNLGRVAAGRRSPRKFVS